MLGLSICLAVLAAFMLSGNLSCIVIQDTAKIEYYDPAHPPPEVARELAGQAGRCEPQGKEQAKTTKTNAPETTSIGP